MDIKVGDWVRVQAGPQCYYAVVEGVVSYVFKDGDHWMIESLPYGDKPRYWYWKQRHDGGAVLEHRPQ